MPITPVKAPRLYVLIAEQLRDLIRRGEYRRDDRLPSERDLTQLLRVKRGPVREALVALELAGLIRHGEDGWYVTAAPAAPAASGIAPERARSPSDILQVRVLIECAAIQQMAQQPDPASVAALRELVDQFRAEAEAGEYHGDADRRFHVAIAQATGNAVLVDLVAQLWDLQEQQFFTLVERMIGNQAVRIQRYVAEHETMLAAIASRDGAAAAERMRRHLTGVAEDLLGA